MAPRSLNKVTLIGNLTRDPELRYTPQGTAVCTIGLATNRSWVDSNNQRQEETEFHRIVAWHKLAELCSQLLFKGRKVYVEGRLQTRRWTGSDGAERVTTEIVIDNMIVLDSKRKEEGEGEFATAMAEPIKPEAKGTISEPVFPSTPQASQAGSSSDAKLKPADEQKKKKAVAKPAAKKEEQQTKKNEVENEKEEVKADDIPF